MGVFTCSWNTSGESPQGHDDHGRLGAGRPTALRVSFLSFWVLHKPGSQVLPDAGVNISNVEGIRNRTGTSWDSYIKKWSKWLKLLGRRVSREAMRGRWGIHSHGICEAPWKSSDMRPPRPSLFSPSKYICVKTNMNKNFSNNQEDPSNNWLLGTNESENRAFQPTAMPPQMHPISSDLRS